MATNRIALDDILEAVSSFDYVGFCVECGERVEGVEPDGREYECPACGSPSVHGAEELLIMSIAY